LSVFIPLTPCSAVLAAFAARNHESLKREGFAFYRYECPTDRSYPPVKVRRIRLLEIGKESTNPRR
jgi:hypothetical protein